MTRWSDELEAFVAESPLVRRPIARFVDAFASSLPAGSTVLDAGAGLAPYRALFRHCHYTAHDWDKSLYELPTGPDVTGDLTAGLDLPAGSFDAVLCTEVLEHVDRPEAAVAELRRLTKPGGRLAVTVPFVYPLHEEPHDHHRFTNHGLELLLESAGFRVTSVAPIGGWFSVLGQVLREQAFATQGEDRRDLRQRFVGFACLVLSKIIAPFAPWLDEKLDTRRALPNGWAASADG